MGVVDSHPPHKMNGYGVIALVLFILGMMAGLAWVIWHFPEIWAAHWPWLLLLGFAVVLYPLGKWVVPLGWAGHRALRAHQREEELHRQRVAELKSIEQLLINAKTEGFHVEYTNAHTGQSVKVTNPQVGRITGIREEKTGEEAKPLLLTEVKSIPIPTFAESLAKGDIQPGQREILICHELERDEETGKPTGLLLPYRDTLENNCTMFLGGASKSGKSTLMAYLSAQEALMNALFYIIDPHLKHPERSIAAKIAPLSHAFILPPAMTDKEVKAVLEHATIECIARLEGRETRYSDRPIVFIVDEVLNLYGRAQRNPDNADIQALYRDLALFMRDLGTQYNKYGVNGIFGSQYVTKDAFKLPSGNIDFRDGCQNQTLLRLPANQAQAMRLLARDELRGVRQLPPGHGYMGFSTGEVIRMAVGNITQADIALAGQMAQAVPTQKIVVAGWASQTSQVSTASEDIEIGEREVGDSGDTIGRKITGDLVREVYPLEKLASQTSQDTTSLASQASTSGKSYVLSEVEIPVFLAHYEHLKNIDKALAKVGHGARYQAHASQILRDRGLL